MIQDMGVETRTQDTNTHIHTCTVTAECNAGVCTRSGGETDDVATHHVESCEEGQQHDAHEQRRKATVPPQEACDDRL
jgi:hypothetical protein